MHSDTFTDKQFGALELSCSLAALDATLALTPTVATAVWPTNMIDGGDTRTNVACARTVNTTHVDWTYIVRSGPPIVTVTLYVLAVLDVKEHVATFDTNSPKVTPETVDDSVIESLEGLETLKKNCELA